MKDINVCFGVWLVGWWRNVVFLKDRDPLLTESIKFGSIVKSSCFPKPVVEPQITLFSTGPPNTKLLVGERKETLSLNTVLRLFPRSRVPTTWGPYLVARPCILQGGRRRGNEFPFDLDFSTPSYRGEGEQKFK